MQRWPIPRTHHAALALTVTCAVLAVVAAPSLAIVPPADCGRMTVQTKRYTIKADQLGCVTARSHAKRYLSTHRRPTGYTCRNFSGETKLKFRCSRGVKVFFAIRR